MKVVNGSREHRKSSPTGVGLGNFDGLHIGHMSLIDTLINESKLNSLESAVYTFTKHPENIIRKKLFTPLITTVNKKVNLLEQTSLDYLYFDEFDENFSRMPPEAFVRDILLERLNIKLAVAGIDYRFGYMGKGDTDLLKRLGEKYGFKVLIIPPVTVEGSVVSSTIIRKCIAKGDMDKASKLLGRHYSITGKVNTGRRLGNTFGFPTANVHPEEYLIMPSDGVYITKTLVGDEMFYSITNIGKNPTISENNKTSVETHILDYDKNIYGEKIEVYFIKKLRNEKKFNSIEDLVVQIKEDVIKARKYFEASNNLVSKI